MALDHPHLTWPLRRGANGHLNVVEQDTAEHVDSCEWAIAAYPIGFREDRPDFGWPRPTGRNIPVDPQPLVDALDRLEPRGINRTAEAYADMADPSFWTIEVDSEVSSQ